MFLLILLLVFVAVASAVYLLVPVLRIHADSYFKQALKQAEADVDSLFLEMQARQILYVTVFCAGFSLLIGLVLSGGNLISALVCAVLGYFLPRYYFKYQRGRRLDRLNDQLVSAIGMLANSLKAGTNFNQALQLVAEEMPAPISQEFALVMREMELGISMPEALDNLSNRVGSEEFELVVRATNIAQETGGNLAEVFERIARTLRDRTNVLGKIRSLTAEGKMQAIFVGFLPLIVGVFMMVFRPDLMMAFVTSVPGILLIILAFILEFMGIYIIKRVITIEV